VITEPVQVERKSSGVGVILSPDLRVGSVMLWLTYFMGLVIFYALINWMPILFRDAGLDPRTSTLIASVFPLGGIGAVAFGWLMDRFNANRIIAIGYALTAVSIFAIGQVVGNLGLLVVTVFVGGGLLNTAQSSMPALAAAFYPTQGRATGVAWMLGIGRFGGIAGSFLVAELTARQLTFGQIFMVLAIPGAIATLALLVKQAVRPEDAAAKAAGRTPVTAH
jgi:AAHS family 4-hydroxybenzoate transporter-like MFS transporter